MKTYGRDVRVVIYFDDDPHEYTAGYWVVQTPDNETHYEDPIDAIAQAARESKRYPIRRL
jgi:hypothetical protein